MALTEAVLAEVGREEFGKRVPINVPNLFGVLNQPLTLRAVSPGRPVEIREHPSEAIRGIAEHRDGSVSVSSSLLRERKECGKCADPFIPTTFNV